MLPLKQDLAFVAKTARISHLADACYKLVIFRNIACLFMKQQMTCIRDYIIACLFQITRTCGVKGLMLKGNI